MRERGLAEKRDATDVRPAQHGPVRKSANLLAGVALGAVLAVAEFAFLLVSSVGLVPIIAAPRSRDRVVGFVHRCSRQLVVLEQRRLARFHDIEDLGPYSDRNAFRYIARRWPVGGLGGLVLLLLLFGLVVAGSMVTAWITGGSWALIEDGADRISTATVIVAAIPGALLLYLNIMGIVGIAGLDERLARRHLAPSAEEVLARRVSELTLSRAEVVQVINDERRRIERDLHDGVQQRLVALGMLLSRARRTDDPDHASALVKQAHEESQQALDDLRQVAWRVYPTVLDQQGLRDVIAVLAERSSIPVTLHYDLPTRPPATIETVAYFVVAEAVTNAAKHSGATQIDITLRLLAWPPPSATASSATSGAVGAAARVEAAKAAGIVGAVEVSGVAGVPGVSDAAGVAEVSGVAGAVGMARVSAATGTTSLAGMRAAPETTSPTGTSWAAAPTGAAMTGVLVTVTDDGRGGADPAGRGLSGLAGRVAASDGNFSVHSPVGGPTTIRAELPCE
ncbi:histidine kinase [Kribbella qitaiheensis]|uniref:histidine kinase n=1 Tax=Kribbella qitaiheensis TaxID=1544730 RepID=UPI003612A288